MKTIPLRKSRVRTVSIFLPAILGAAIAISGRLYAEDPAAPPAVPEAPAAPAEPTAAPAATPPAASASADKVDYVGAETCLSCHSGQGDFKDSVHGRSLVQGKGIAYEKTCETCHGPGSLHAAAAGDKANPGYGTVRTFKNISARALNDTCLECHQDQKRNNWVGSPHEKRDVSCLTCHSIHEPKSKKLLLVKPNIEQVCAECHRSQVSKVRRSQHMPVIEGKMSCSSCHNPHGTATPKMLTSRTGNENCYACHADKRGPFLWEHLPVRENCLNCHDAHGSHHPNMLQAKQPFLCQRCHVQAQHRSTAYDQSSIKNLDNKVMLHSCANCHTNIHGSNHPSGKFFTR